MTSWRTDPAAAAHELIGRALDGIALAGRVLVANGQAQELAERLAPRGIVGAAWARRAEEGSARETVGCWPPAGPFDAALLRLPRAKDEQLMTTHAVISVLGPAGKLIVYGGNDEGIRSAAGMLQRTCGAVETVVARGHGRVLAATAPSDRSRIKATLASWRRTLSVPIGGVPRPFVTYPGVFAGGGIDAASRLLTDALPELGDGARVLDFGCGSGFIAASALARAASCKISIALDMLDNDAVALTAARENVPEARPILAAGVGGAAKGYALILSNPPLHHGVAEDHRVLAELIAGAADHLAPGGMLQLVVQRRVGVHALLARSFADVRVAAESPSFRVWRAQGAQPTTRPFGAARSERHR